MTTGITARTESLRVGGGQQLAAQCRETGTWVRAAAWLADVLNDTEPSTTYRQMRQEQRSRAAEVMSRYVAVVDGDHRDPDIITLPDGSRVCLHLAFGRARARWVVERVSERCQYGQPGYPPSERRLPAR
jgi:hypothetical protein